MGRDEALPPEVVKQVFGQLSFMTPEDIENWIDLAVEAQTQEEGEESNKAGNSFFNNYMKDKTTINENISKYTERITGELVREVYFNTAKESNFTEGIKSTRHFYHSHDRVVNYKEKIILDLFEDELQKDKLDE